MDGTYQSSQKRTKSRKDASELIIIYNSLRKITDPVTPAREKSTKTLIHEFYTLLKMAYYTLKSFSYQQKVVIVTCYEKYIGRISKKNMQVWIKLMISKKTKQ